MRGAANVFGPKSLIVTLVKLYTLSLDDEKSPVYLKGQKLDFVCGLMLGIVGASNNKKGGCNWKGGFADSCKALLKTFGVFYPEDLSFGEFVEHVRDGSYDTDTINEFTNLVHPKKPDASPNRQNRLMKGFFGEIAHMKQVADSKKSAPVNPTEDSNSATAAQQANDELPSNRDQNVSDSARAAGCNHQGNDQVPSNRDQNASVSQNDVTMGNEQCLGDSPSLNNTAVGGSCPSVVAGDVSTNKVAEGKNDVAAGTEEFYTPNGKQSKPSSNVTESTSDTSGGNDETSDAVSSDKDPTPDPANVTQDTEPTTNQPEVPEPTDPSAAPDRKRKRNAPLSYEESDVDDDGSVANEEDLVAEQREIDAKHEKLTGSAGKPKASAGKKPKKKTLQEEADYDALMQDHKSNEKWGDKKIGPGLTIADINEFMENEFVPMTSKTELLAIFGTAGNHNLKIKIDSKDLYNMIKSKEFGGDTNTLLINEINRHINPLDMGTHGASFEDTPFLWAFGGRVLENVAHLPLTTPEDRDHIAIERVVKLLDKFVDGTLFHFRGVFTDAKGSKFDIEKTRNHTSFQAKFRPRLRRAAAFIRFIHHINSSAHEHGHRVLTKGGEVLAKDAVLPDLNLGVFNLDGSLPESIRASDLKAAKKGNAEYFFSFDGFPIDHVEDMEEIVGDVDEDFRHVVLPDRQLHRTDDDPDLSNT